MSGLLRSLQKKDTLILIKILIKSFNHPSVYTEKPKVSYDNFFLNVAVQTYFKCTNLRNWIRYKKTNKPRPKNVQYIAPLRTFYRSIDPLRWSEWNIVYAATFEMCPYYFFLKKTKKTKKNKSCSWCKVQADVYKIPTKQLPFFAERERHLLAVFITGRHKAAATRFWDFLKKIHIYKISSLLNSVLTLTHFKWVNVWK